MNRHRLKTWLAEFKAIRTGEKTFEVRRDDRGFRAGDVLELAEWDEHKGEFTGREELRRVAFILDGGRFGVEAGFVVMALAGVPDRKPPEADFDLDGLAAWHRSVAVNARIKASNWRYAAEKKGASAVTGDSYIAAAAGASAEAAFHERAADLIAAALRAALAPEEV